MIKPIIVGKGAHIIAPERLHAIYERTYKECIVHSDKSVRDKTLDENIFDYQCALGSIPQYLYRDLHTFKSRKFQLSPNKKNSNSLREKYLKNSDKEIIIGISWQGGGRKDRIKDKSIELGDLLVALKPYKVKILSLQYGDDNKIVQKAASKFGVDFIDDEDVQATNDMDNWLDQVNACDGVVSIANTTIHGAGGLNIPTLCLLGSSSDWRWLNDRSEKFSYWYPSVEIAWQEVENKNWGPALKKIDDWMQRTLALR